MKCEYLKNTKFNCNNNATYFIRTKFYIPQHIVRYFARCNNHKTLASHGAAEYVSEGEYLIHKVLKS